MRKGFCSRLGTDGRHRATRSWNINSGRCSTRSIFLHCGLHAFRHSVASFIVDAGYAPEVAQQQLRHSNSRTTLQYIHLGGGLTEQAMADVSNSLLDVLGRGQGKGSPYIQ